MKKPFHCVNKITGALAVFVLLMTAACENKQNQQNQVKELKATDSLFSKMSIEKGMKNAFLTYLDSSAVLLRSNHMPFEGIASVKRYFDGFSDTSFILSWKPLKAKISPEGALGYTYGIYEINDKASGKSNGKGTYITIWQKDNNCRWKAVFDTGIDGTGESIPNP
ncbi:MAG: hypothetical protein ACOYMF_01880 [Bacteroidales bacterium]